MVNEIMDARADMACEDGATARNGYRERGLATPVGDIVLRIPKLCAGTHFPEGLIERRSPGGPRRRGGRRGVVDNGVSTRKMERIARKMGIGRLSKDQVSAMCRSLDAGVAELFSRDLGEVGFPYLFLDATYVKCRRDGRMQSTAVVTAIGVGSDGVRRMLGVAAIDTETHAGWLGFLRGLRERGFSGARLVVSDAHAGSCAPSPSACRAPAGSVASCTSSATSAPCWPRGATGRWPARPFRPSSARPTPPP